MKPRIIILPRYTGQFASSRVRFLYYAEKWKQAGWEVKSQILFNKDYSRFIHNKRFSLSFGWYILKRFIARLYFLLFKVTKHDILLIQVELFPMLPAWAERVLRWRKIPFIIDYDDADFRFYENSENFFVKKLLSKKFSHIVSMADHVITGSVYLTDYAIARNNNVTEIPTSVLMKEYTSVHQTGNQHSFTIGWIGSETTSKFIDDIAEVLRSFIEKHQTILLLIGYKGTLLKDHPQIKNYEWTKKTEASLLHSIDVGIMPLRTDDFSQGKCGFKLIQYMACGKPTISTPLQANKNIDGGIGNLFASSNEEWYDALDKVYNNQAYYKAIGQQNLQRIEMHYSIENNYKKYLVIFDALASKLKFSQPALQVTKAAEVKK